MSQGFAVETSSQMASELRFLARKRGIALSGWGVSVSGLSH